MTHWSFFNLGFLCKVNMVHNSVFPFARPFFSILIKILPLNLEKNCLGITFCVIIALYRNSFSLQLRSVCRLTRGQLFPVFEDRLFFCDKNVAVLSLPDVCNVIDSSGLSLGVFSVLILFELI